MRDARSMSILMTADTIGGVWTYALDLIESLAPRNVHVHLATMGAAPDLLQRRQISGLSNATLHESHFKLEWMHDPWRDVERAGQWLLELERDLRPDLVHLNNYAHASLPFAAPVLVVGHSCVLSWWRAVKGKEAPRDWDRYRIEVRAGLHSADHVVAPSQAMLDALNDHYGPLARTSVIYNGRSPRCYQSSTTTALPSLGTPGEGRVRAGLQPSNLPKESIILSAGRLWDEAKNLAMLERIAPDVPWPAYVAGDDTSPDGTIIRSRATQSLGKLAPPDLAHWLSRASIYALPARYEPFGLSVLEAALSGCALVLSDIPSLREIWRDDALFVPPDDAAAWSRSLRRMIEHRTFREDLARRAQTRARQFSHDRMAARYYELYLDLIECHQPARCDACAS